jgi:hypothetical protein
MLISTNIASTGPTEHTEDVNKAEDKALAHTEKTVQGTYTAEKDTRKAKEIEHSDRRRSATFVINQAAG